MAQLPADRTKLNAAIQNQQPSIVADAIANREALVEAYDTIDLLNQKVDTAISNGKMGNEISSDVDMRGYRIRNLAAPTSNTDVARKAEVDGKVSKSGDTMTGLLTALGGINVHANITPPDTVGSIFTNGATGSLNYRDLTGFHIVWHNGLAVSSLAGNGYQKLPSGVIIQWGTTPDIDPSTTGGIVFPVVFPNACFVVLATVESWPDVAAAVVNSISTNVCGVNHNASAAKKIRWIAIGY